MSTLEADVTFISRSKGGRKSLPLSGTENYSYRPHIVLGDLEQRKAIMDGNVITEPYISVAFHSFPEDLEFNKPFRAELAFRYAGRPASHCRRAQFQYRRDGSGLR